VIYHMNNVTRVISRGLRRARLARNVSQQQVAEMLGTGATQISRYERGEQDPTATRLVELAILYGISLDDLVDLGRWDDEE